MLNYDTNTLIGVVSNLHTPTSFLLDLFYPNMVCSNTEEVTVDIIKGQRRLAPYVSPMSQGKVMEGQRRSSKSFKPAYLKPKGLLDPQQVIRRAVGEQIGGSLTAGEREKAALGLMLEDQVNSIHRTLEYQAGQGLQNGKLIISGEDYETVQIDFTREADLTKALTGDAAWNTGAGASPTDDVEDWATLILKTSGCGVTDIVFTPKSWKAFKKDPVLKDHEFFAGGNSQGNDVRLGAEVEAGGVYKGMWGTYRLWLYNNWYLDANGVLQPVLEDGSVIMSSKALQGTRAFGVIVDAGMNYPAIPFAPKSWIPDDPAIRHVMTQSAPLMIPSNIDASLCVNVIE